MIKLYHSPGACSFAAHLALEESGLPFEVVRVNLAGGEQRTADYLAINPKGRVPSLVDGEFVLTEVPALLRYVALRAPEKGLWPRDPRDDARCAEWLAWISSGVHVAYAHVRRAERYADSEAGRAEVVAKGRVTARDTWEMVERRLAGRTWAAGDAFSVADLYLVVFWTWGRGQVLAYDMPADFPAWTAHARRVAERPAVRRVFERDGIALP
ncbi:glutathione S-transferase family protein [Alsobacter sp. SYSU M60028]|uniref:Glutathione S-transferase family protein n=1 Tax=Alsobacter ponti TaxID=2962936 RepID=A0ABT1L710_9HYPH|nr:glutathione S-transferase family protein [Alsobacter ponti]MCP8937215.1 glutathione S-transferase family protein [Alsobacter ponti]